MKIYAISLIKNEADIIEENLKAAAQWATKIIVFDNGSFDGTWEIVQRLRSQVIYPWKQEEKPFYDGLRGEVFNAFKSELHAGDWWCFLDADEFYLDDPCRFLAAVPSRFQFVCKLSIDFALCVEDLREWTFTGRFAADRQYLRYYSPFGFSEKRFFRHQSDLNWLPGCNMPHALGRAYTRRIPVAHYPWRSVQQIQTRLQTRFKTLEQGYDGWDHLKPGRTWQRYLRQRRFLLRADPPKPCRVLWVQNTFRDWAVTTGVRWCLNRMGLWPRHRWRPKEHDPSSWKHGSGQKPNASSKRQGQ